MSGDLRYNCLILLLRMPIVRIRGKFRSHCLPWVLSWLLTMWCVSLQWDWNGFHEIYYCGPGPHSPDILMRQVISIWNENAWALMCPSASCNPCQYSHPKTFYLVLIAAPVVWAVHWLTSPLTGHFGFLIFTDLYLFITDILITLWSVIRIYTDL